MRIVSGLFDNMVLQRDAKGFSDTVFEGAADCDGAVLVSVRKGKTALRGLSKVKAGTVKGGVLHARLKGVRTGGPYTVIVEIAGRSGAVADSLTVRNVLIGDVWVLAGQSNMEGIGYISHALAPLSLARAFYMDDTWGVARDPLHEKNKAVDEAHAIIAGGIVEPRQAHVGTGPGVAFAQELLRITNVPQGVIACAHGGTSMAQWDPSDKGPSGKTLYSAMLRRVRKNGGKIAGVFWYQGCSDTDPYNASLYTERMKALVAAVRSDIGPRGLAWCIVQIASVCGESAGAQSWNSIQEQQRLLQAHIKHVAVVPAIDLALDDSIHIAGYEQNRLGARAAGAMAVLSGRNLRGKPPIELRSVKVETDPVNGCANVVVSYKNVVGKLVAKGRPWGFCLTGTLGEFSTAWDYRVDLEGDTAIVKCVAPRSEVECLFLHYGAGRRPLCNITDEADRSLPVSGPYYLGGKSVYTPFITRMRISRFMPSAGKLHDLAYPQDKAPLEMKVRQFDGTFCSLHPEIAAAGLPDLLVYFAVTVRCAETMNIELWLGYDGPVKMWVDGEEKLFDPAGVNPALSDDSKTPLYLQTGEHEVLVALGSNNLKAWGIFMRIARTGVPAALIAQGAEAYAVPQIVV